MSSASEIKQASKYDGKWVIETNGDTINMEDAACGYKGLMVIERCFRSLKKTQIKMTSMYHWVPRRIEIHVRLCVLALLIERVASYPATNPGGKFAKRGSGCKRQNLRILLIVFFTATN
jgi:transposase